MGGVRQLTPIPPVLQLHADYEMCTEKQLDFALIRIDLQNVTGCVPLGMSMLVTGVILTGMV